MKNAKARGMSELSMGILEGGWKRVRCCEEMSSAPREEARLTKPANANEGAQHQASINPPHNNTTLPHNPPLEIIIVRGNIICDISGNEKRERGRGWGSTQQYIPKLAAWGVRVCAWFVGRLEVVGGSDYMILLYGSRHYII